VRPVVFLASVGLLASPSAWTQPAALHDIPWYVGHSAARETTLTWCHQDSSRADSFDCQNAQAAAAGTMFRDTGNRDPNDMMSPAYWSANPLARAGVLLACVRRQPGNEMQLRYCGPASYSAAHDPRLAARP
jgi:hypothetical protein